MAKLAQEVEKLLETRLMIATYVKALFPSIGKGKTGKICKKEFLRSEI